MVILSYAQLIAWHRFTEGTSSISNDMSGSGNHAVLGSSAPTYAMHGLYFDGTSDYVDMPSNSVVTTSLNLTPPITFTIWIYRKVIPMPNYLALFDLQGASKTLRFTGYIKNGSEKPLQLTIQTTSGTYDVTGSGTFVDYGDT